MSNEKEKCDLILTYERCEARITVPSFQVGAVHITQLWKTSILRQLAFHQPIHALLQAASVNLDILGRLAEAFHDESSQPGRSWSASLLPKGTVSPVGVSVVGLLPSVTYLHKLQRLLF